MIPILLCYFVLCFFLHPASSIRHGVLNDPDANMYLVQTLNLLDGQGWYDRVEHRLDPPQGVLMHFSRLAELPYAAVMAPLQPVLGRIPAALLASIIWPPVFLLGLMLVMRWQARLFLPEAWAELTAFTTLFAQNLPYEFMPGRAGHRGLVPLLVALAVAFLSRLVLKPDSWRWAVAAGCVLTLALSFSIEALPWALILAGMLGFWAAAQGGEWPARSGLAFGAGLAGTAIPLLALYRLPAQWLTVDLISFSYVYVILLFGIATCFTALWAMRHRPLGQRLCIAAGAAILIGGSFLLAFPQLLAGPYGGVNSRLFHLMMFNITEAVPLYKRVNFISLVFSVALWPLASLVVCLWHIRHGDARQRWLWSGFALLQSAAFFLTVFYQARCADYMQMFGIVPLTIMLYHGLRERGKSQKIDLIARRIIILAVLPIMSIGFGAIIYGTTPTNLAFFPMQSFMDPCRDIRAAAAVLNRPPYNQGEPKRIISAMNEGPGLLLFTQDSILSAPYPMDVTGNLDTLDFFHATDPLKAERIAQNRDASFVLSCRYIESGYLAPEGTEMDFYKLGYMDVPNPPPLAFRLMRGYIPDWLVPVTPEKLGNIMLFEVR